VTAAGGGGRRRGRLAARCGGRAAPHLEAQLAVVIGLPPVYANILLYGLQGEGDGTLRFGTGGFSPDLARSRPRGAPV
jgi:hypothetical protein